MAKYAKASDIKVGVIGYGGAFNMGRQHLNEMKKAGMTPTAVSEIDPDRLKVATTDFPGIEIYSDVSTMLRKSKVDLLAIITPHNTHAKLALQCLNSGRHAVCEKPLAITTTECDAMILAAKKHKTVLSTYHNRHWDGWILRAIKEIKSGAIGEVYKVEAHMGGYGKPGDWWRTSKTISGGILYDWGVHLLEYSLQVVNSELIEVSGYAKQGFWAKQSKWKHDTNEDEGFAVARFKSGAWVTLDISSVDNNPRRGFLEVTGTKGSYLIDWSGWELYTTDDNGEKVMRKGKHWESQGHKFYQNIADHLVKGKPLVITPEWSRRPIHILDLACQSAKKGVAIKATYR